MAFCGELGWVVVTILELVWRDNLYLYVYKHGHVRLRLHQMRSTSVLENHMYCIVPQQPHRTAPHRITSHQPPKSSILDTDKTQHLHNYLTRSKEGRGEEERRVMDGYQNSRGYTHTYVLGGNGVIKLVGDEMR